MRKTKLMIIIFTIMFFVFSIPVFAADLEAPEIKADTLSISKTEATIGDKVKFSVQITDKSQIKDVQVKYRRPQCNDMKLFVLAYNSSTGLYEVEFDVDNNYPSGTWIVEEIYVNDIKNNSETVYNKYAQQYMSPQDDFSAGNFTVTGTNADVTKPVINEKSLTLSTDKVVVGDNLKVTLEIIDESEMSSAKIFFQADNESDSKNVYLNYNSNTGLYEGVFNVEEDDAEGKWKISLIEVIDTNNNKTTIYSQTTQYLKTYSFYNYQYYTKPEYVDNSLKVSSATVTQNESVKVSLSAEDDFGIDNVKIIYINPETNEEYTVNTVYENGSYVGEISFGTIGYNGTWKINRIEIMSIKNVLNTIYNSKTTDKTGAKDLSAGDFTTEDLVQDSDKPFLVSSKINNKYAYLNDKVTIELEADDLTSEVKSVSINYTLPDGTSKDYTFLIEDNTYFYDFIFDEVNKKGKYTANYILIEDIAGNVLKEENVEKLDFYFIEQIKIIGGSYYLENYYTIYLAALVYPEPNEDYELVWSTSDASIAAIDATSGALVTANKTGKVTIKVALKDNPNIYGTIEFCVGMPNVAVDETVSLGNSTSTQYSEVEWEIEDDTVLQDTGNRGMTSINSYYKHTITVKGLKIGKTILRMTTVAGTTIAESEVYVYNPIKSITADIDKIVLEKGEQLKLNIKLSPGELSKEMDDIFFISEDDTIATVTQDGIVTAYSAGKTYIVVYSQYYGKELNIPVDVVVYTTDLRLDTYEVNFTDNNRTHQIVGQILPSDSTFTLAYSSSNPYVISVDENGLITALKDGTAIITVKTTDGKQIKQIYATANGLKTDINGLYISDFEDKEYERLGAKQDILIKDGDYTLIENVDYTVEYINNKTLGEAIVLINGIGVYNGGMIKKFNIIPKDINKITQEFVCEDLKFNCQEVEFNPILKDGNYTLIENLDFTIEYFRNYGEGQIVPLGPDEKPRDAFNYKIKITGMNNYTGSFEKDFLINTLDLSELQIFLPEEIIYEGKEITYEDIAKNGSILKYQDEYGTYYDAEIGNDFMVDIQSNTSPGTMIVRIYGGWSCTGEDIVKEITIKKLFNDIKESAWFFNAVKFCYDKGMIMGTTSTTFSPTIKLTRGMLVTILYRIDGKVQVEGDCKFPDVAEDMYYYNSIKWASANGIVKGYEDGKFRPNKNVTREELVVILRNYLRSRGVDTTATTDLSVFNDGHKVSSFAKSAMEWAVANKVVTGYTDDNTLKPQGTTLRAEAASVFYKYFKNKEL